MKRIIVTNAGGRLGIGVTRCYQAAPEPIYTIGVDSDAYHLQRSVTSENHLIPRANEDDYCAVLRAIIAETKPDLLWVNHEAEIAVIAKAAPTLDVRLFLPRLESIMACQDKMDSYRRWRDAGLAVPQSMMVHTPDDLATAFRTMGKALWVRAINGTGGRGSLPVSDAETARAWIDFHRGWGRFMIARRLTEKSITWESIWDHGNLVAAQSRNRLYWEFSSLTFSGVTGIGGAHVFLRDPKAEETAKQAVSAIDPSPHGVFSVDMTYDEDGVPNITEINIGRFMSGGVNSLTPGGVNLPYLACQCAFGERDTAAAPILNPIQEGTVLVHGMDVEPVVSDVAKTQRIHDELDHRRSNSRWSGKPENSAQRSVDSNHSRSTARVAIVLSPQVDPALQSRIQAGRQPRQDFTALAEKLGATVLTPGGVKAPGVKPPSMPARILRAAWAAFKRRNDFDIIITDLDRVGLVFAALLGMTGSRTKHIVVCHGKIASAFDLTVLRILHLQSHIDRFVCYGPRVAERLRKTLHLSEDRVITVTHAADQRFWHPLSVPPGRYIASAGMENRDYDTLVEAVRGLDVSLTIAAFSPWVSARKKGPQALGIPANVTTTRCTPEQLRELYAKSLFVAIPLKVTQGQAGSLVTYEAMAMGKAVVTTATEGQQGMALLENGVSGYYVAPGDIQGWRKTIQHLLDHPEQAAEMGRRARAAVEQRLNFDSYLRTMVAMVDSLAAEAPAADLSRKSARAASASRPGA